MRSETLNFRAVPIDSMRFDGSAWLQHLNFRLLSLPLHLIFDKTPLHAAAWNHHACSGDSASRQANPHTLLSRNIFCVNQYQLRLIHTLCVQDTENLLKQLRRNKSMILTGELGGRAEPW